MKACLGFCILVFLSVDGLSQLKSNKNDNDIYLSKVALTESLIALKKFKEARETFGSLAPRVGSLEYDYLLAKLNQQSRKEMITQNGLYSIAVIPSGKLLAAGSDSLIYIIDANTLKVLKTLSGHKGAVTTLEFSKDGKWLVSGSRDKTVIIWDSEEWMVLKKLSGHGWNGIYGVVLSPDRTRLGVTTWKFENDHVVGLVHLFDAQSWEQVSNLEAPSPHPVSAIDYTPDGQGLVYGTWGLVIHYYDFVQRNVRWILNMMDNHEYSSVTAIEVAPDNNSVLVATKDTKVRLLDKSSGRIVTEPDPYQWHNDEVNDATFSPTGARFASCSIDQSINLGDATTGQKLSTLLGHQSSVSELVYHPDGSNIYSVDSDGMLFEWNIDQSQSTTVRGCPDPGYGRGLFLAAADATGDRLALACGKEIIIHNLKEQSQASLDVATYYGIDFCENNQLVVGGTEGKLSIWDLKSQTRMKEFDAHDDYIQKVVYLGDSKLLSSSGNVMKLWDLKEEKMLAAFEADGFIYSFVYSPKNKVIIAAASGGQNYRIDPTTLSVKSQWRGSSAGSCISLAPDEQHFAIGQSDGTVAVYETRSNKSLSQFKDSDGGISSLLFDVSGKYVITTTLKRTQTVKFWDTGTRRTTLTLHEYSDIMNIVPLGRGKHFALLDKHGGMWLVRY